MDKLIIALVGNPNAGKSTVFNALTGLRQKTANWPGKTVEKKVGTCTHRDPATGREVAIELVDLPGAYSLSAFSPDEAVARDFLIGEHPDAVICVVDATNLERNLYLVVQVMELGLPAVVALNMTDQAQSMDIAIDATTLSHLLGGCPVVPTTASRGKGIERLLAATVDLVGEKIVSAAGDRCQCRNHDAFQVNYGREIEEAIQEIRGRTNGTHLLQNGACPRWTALKLLEGERDIVERIEALPGAEGSVSLAREQAVRLQSVLGDDVDIITADQRYGTVSGITRQVLRRPSQDRVSLTDRLDDVVTHRLIGLPIFLFVMYVIFRLVIDVSAPFLDWFDAVFAGPVTRGLSGVLAAVGAPEWFHSLVIDGAVAGVGGILTFVPGLIVLFFFLALLEDSGYMARAAFVMDRFMRIIGLHGKSVIPLMLGFGCAVPAIYATRTIASRRDRLLTALLIPFMSCSARLPVYVVFALAFFGAQASTVIWLMYVLGVAVAVGVGFIFSRTLLKQESRAAFVLELPPYRRPAMKGLFIHTWENTREFIRNAGTVILAISIILWFLLNLPWGVTEQKASLYGRFSTGLTPILEPAGFGSWESSGALISGFIAKELVVSSLSQIYVGDGDLETVVLEKEESLTIRQELTSVVTGFFTAAGDSLKTLLSLLPGVDLLGDEAAVEDTTLSLALRDNYTPLAAFAFLVFVLLYVPCAATIGAIKQEFGGRWAATAATYQTAIAWLAAVLVFQGGRLLGLG